MAATLCIAEEAGQVLDETLKPVEDEGLATGLETRQRPPLKHRIGISFNAGASAGLAGGATEVQHPLLSQREIQIVQLISEGLTDRQIATRLGISPRTVDGHLRRIFAKVGAPSRAALAAWAVRRGVV